MCMYRCIERMKMSVGKLEFIYGLEVIASNSLLNLLLNVKMSEKSYEG